MMFHHLPHAEAQLLPLFLFTKSTVTLKLFSASFPG